MTLAFIRTLLLSLVVVSLFNSCSKEISVEQLHADSTLTKAMDAAQRGEVDQARELLSQAYSLDRLLGRIPQMAEEQVLLAENAFATADFDTAIEHYAVATDHFKSLADRGSARTMVLKTAAIYRYAGDERKAHAMYTEALRLANVFHDAAGANEIRWEMVPSCRALDDREE